MGKTEMKCKDNINQRGQVTKEYLWYNSISVKYKNRQNCTICIPRKSNLKIANKRLLEKSE